ncbi:hypothetical protein E6W36_13485 [Hankyongella ginsenosidimutans]|uniref:Uncharacterized protein n=1 Tax=Hankyongella ginsenosidimutans TaxID=1763828 RepID=A0A4D7CA70_9SPHN|nr:hypothetical protein [Hankyongella ginsenosidimutans]QCI80147.1 hypothetical protein E6W36_13485 [Hankyongella ginsenosidimutans]
MSGDDSLAALTNCRDGAGRRCAYSELNITDAYFHDARVASAHARAIALGIGRQPVTGPNKKSDFPSRAYVARMRYENIDGYSFGWTDQTDFAGTVTDLSARDRPNKSGTCWILPCAMCRWRLCRRTANSRTCFR